MQEWEVSTMNVADAASQGCNWEWDCRVDPDGF